MQATVSHQIEIRPQPGPQEAFLSTPADIAIFGGAAGGGKTFALLMEPLRHSGLRGFGAVIFRREFTQIRAAGGLWDESQEIYRLIGGIPREGFMDWHFPTGSKLQFAHMQREDDRFNWDGSQIPLICFDQLESFTWRQFIYMLSRNRSTCGVTPYVRATCNPLPNHWLRSFLGWWIDDATGLAIKARSGIMRWFVNIDNEIHWADDPGELRMKFGGDAEPKSCTFIPSSIYDNKILLSKNPAYLANLKALQKIDRLRLLDGNWNVRETAGMYFRREWFEIVDAAPVLVRDVRYWDQAATKRKSDVMATSGPSWTAGVKMGKSASDVFYITHIVRLQESALKVEEATDNTASQDGRRVEIVIEQDPGQAGKQTAQYYVRKLGAKGYVARANPVHESKGTRAKPLSAQAEAGNVKLVRGSWNEAFLREAENYDGGIDSLADQIDAGSGAFNELTSSKRAGVW